MNFNLSPLIHKNDFDLQKFKIPMGASNTSSSNNWPFELSPIGTWLYFVIIGFPISIILIILDSVYIAFTDQPIFLQNISRFSMRYNGPIQQVKYYKRSIGQKILLGFSMFIIGVILLSFSLVLGIFGAFKPARELQSSILALFYPEPSHSEQADTTSQIQTISDVKSPVREDLETPSSEKTCYACGEVNMMEAEFCVACGSNLPAKSI